jgi:hypothetical protein
MVAGLGAVPEDLAAGDAAGAPPLMVDETVAGDEAAVALEACPATAVPTTTPEAVAGVNPGKLLGSDCMGELFGANAKPAGMLDGVDDGTAVVGAKLGALGAEDAPTEIGAEEDKLDETFTSSSGLPSSAATFGPVCLRTSNFSKAGLVGANHA